MLNWAVVWMPLVKLARWNRRWQEQSSHDVAVNDLGHDESAIIGHNIKCLRLDIGIVIGPPTEVLLGQFGIGGRLGLLGNRPNGFGAIDGFLSAGNGGKTSEYVSNSRRSMEAKDIRRLQPVHDGKDMMQKWDEAAAEKRRKWKMTAGMKLSNTQ